MPNNIPKPEDILGSVKKIPTPSEILGGPKKKEPTVSPSGQNQESTTSVTPKVTEQKPLDSSSSKGEGIFEFKGRPGAIYKKKADGLWAVDVNNTGIFKDITDPKRIDVLEKQATPTFRTPEERTAFEVAPKPEAKKELTREEKQVQKDFSKDFKVLAKTDPTVIAKNKEDNETYNLLNKIDSDVIASSEGEVVPKLKSMFNGTENDIFDFEETGAGYDAIKVTNRLTGKSQEFSLDNWSSGRDNDESKLLKGFLDVELKFKDQAYNQKRIQELEKLKENQLPIDAMQTQAQIDELRKDVDIDDKLKQNYAVNTGKYATGAVYNKEAVNNTKAKFARANIDAVELKTQKANLDEWKKQADESLTSGSITQEEYDNVYMPKIVAEESDIRDKALNIQSSIDSLKRESGNLDVIAANHIMSQEDRGNFLTGTVKSFIKGVESPFLTIITQNMDNPAEAKRAILEATSPGIVTDEYLKSANRNDFESAVFGLAESIGSNLAGGPAGNASMFVSAYGNYKDELNATPGMENVPEYEKMLLSAGLAAPASIIEKFGIDKIMQKSPIGKKFTNWLLSKTISSLPKKASSEMLEKAIAENLKSAIARGIINVAADGAIEGFSEGAEQLVEGGTKELYDLMKGKDYFDNPKTVGGWLDNIGEAAKLGAIGGASVGAITQSLSVASDKRTAVDFNKIANAIEDDNLKDIIKTSLKAKVLSGEISKMKATEIMKNMESSETILKQIPSSLKPEDKYNAFNLIEEKSNLSKEIAGKDEALVSKQKDRINAINEELKAISNKTEENATKESEQPKQEVSTESNISERQGVESGQQEVGKTEGSERTTTQPEANISDSNIPSEEKVKVSEPVEPTEEQIIDDVKNKRFASFNYENESQIPEQFKDKISSKGYTNGKNVVTVTLPQSVADYEIQKAEYNKSDKQTEEKIVPEQTPTAKVEQAPKVKVEGKKARIDRAKAIVAETPYQMAAQYLLNGGKISRGVLEQLFGNKGGKPIKGEILSRLNIYDKNSDITIDGIAHKIWEDNGGIDSKYDTQEIREAVEDVIANSPQFDKAADLVIAESNKAQSKEIDYAEAMMQKANEDEQAFKNAFTDEENAKLAEEMAQAEFDFSKMDDNVNASDILEDIKSKDKFEEFLNNLIDKTSGKNTMFDASIGIPIAVINASLRAIKASYVVSRDMALAIKEGYKKLVEDGYDQMSEDQYTDMVAKNIARSNKNIKESVDEYKSRGFKDSEIEATLRRTGYSDAEISNAINAYNAPRENQGIDVEQEVQFPIVDENRIKEIDKLVKGEENIDKIVSKGIDNNFTDDEVREYLKAKKNLSDKDASEAVLKYYNKKEGVTVFNNPKNIAQKFSQSLVSFKKRMFSARRFMPIFMRNALEQRDANIAARLHEATRLTNTFTKMYEAYEGNKSELIRNFDAHLRGDYSVDLPVEFAELSNDMRNEIKSLQNELLAAGLLDISDVMKYENDFGMYLTRSYEIFDKKNYKKKIMKDLNSETYIKAMNVIRKQMTETAKQEAIAKNIPFEEALDNLSKNKLEDYLTKNDSEEYRSSKGREGSKDLSILKQRLDIPYEIRMLMGEYSDPGQNFARTVMSMTSLVANNKYLNDLKTLGEGKFFFSANDARKPITHNTLIAPKGSETFNPLNDMYTTPEIAEEFKKVASQSSDAMKMYMKVLSTVKWLKTIASVATHAKNVTSNIFLLIANGHINPKTIGQAYKDLRLDIHPEGNKIRRTFGLKPSKKAIERSHEKIKEYISAGVIKQSAGIGEIRDMFKDADFDTAFASRVNKDRLTVYDKMKKKGVQAKNFAEQLYEAEDDFFKIVAYESEMSRYSKAMFGKNKKNLTEEEYAQLKEKVAEIVKNTFPTYSRVPGIVQMVRKSPIIGTFVAFQAESYRTAYNTMALGFKELSSANIEERKIGIQRILGIGAYKSLSVALTSYFGVAIGTGMTGILGKILDTEDEEEKEKQMRLFVPEWSKDSDLMSLSLKDGVYTFIDQSASDPHGGINRAVNAFMKGGKEGFAEGFYSIVEPFIRPEMTASVLMGLYNNQDAYGERIYNKEADFSTIANEVGAYLYKWVEPGTASSVRKIIKADDKGVEGVGQMTGFKPMKIDIGKQFFFKMKDMRDRLDDIKDIYNDEYSSKDATSKTIADKYEEANRKYEAAQEEIAKYYNAAVQLGSFSNPAKAAEYKRNLIRSVTETAGVSKFSAGRVLNNQKMPLKKRFDKIER